MKKCFLLLLCGATFVFTGCSEETEIVPPVTGENAENPETPVPEPEDSPVAGYLYLTTNGESTNDVVRFSRHEDGSVSDETDYSTNSLGGANIAAGGNAFGDFDSEGAIKIIGDYLLNVNAGGNTVSVFSMDRTNGNLVLKGNVDVLGTRPVSITATPMAGSDTKYWVVVGCQWNNPNVQGMGDGLRRFPNDEFHMMDLTQPDPSDADRNIHLFSFDSSTGELVCLKKLDTYVRENGGPVKVSFSPDGTKLAVDLWGIAHFGTDSPSLDEQHPSRVYVYDFNDGNVSNERFFEEEGIAGSIGFEWAPNSNSTLFVTNFNVTLAKTDNSVTVLEDDGTTVTKTANFATGAADDLDEACWTVINPMEDRLYVSSFTGNVVTPFTLGGSSISGTLPFEARGDNAPPADSKDLFITSDNKYLYQLGAFQSFSINIFDVTEGGVDYREQVTLETTKGGLGQPGQFNFLGLVGFDLEQQPK